MSECTHYPSILPPEALDAIYDNVIMCRRWSLDLRTDQNVPESPNPFLDLTQEYPKDLNETVQYLENARDQLVEDFCGRQYSAIKHHSFQVTYEGHHGHLHTDGLGQGYVTCMFFLSPEWSSEWGGDFTIQTRNEEWATIPYSPGSCVCFEGSLLHKGSGANVRANRVRLTYVTHGVT